MIDEADRDGDGEVSEQEFLRIMKKTSLYWYLLPCYTATPKDNLKKI